MPCPLFEPQRVAKDPHNTAARLPLLEEYDGLCHAGEPREAVPPELRFRCCNHGYSQGVCRAFPAEEKRASLRYTVTRSDPKTIQLMLITERDYTPVTWQSLEYFVGSDCIQPDLADPCLRAQVLAFCRSYLKLFSRQ
jgi:hypothetical protein